MTATKNALSIQKDATSQLLSIMAERTFQGDWDKMATQLNKLTGKTIKGSTVKRYAAGYGINAALPSYITTATMTLVSKKLRTS